MWPDCSPPSDRSRLSISSITYLSPTGHAHQLDAERRCSASSRPMLLITVATMASPLQPPFALQLAAAHQQHRVAVDDVAAVIDEDRAIAVAVERDAHARSRARRRSRASRSGWVEPQSRLMLRPSGSLPMTMTSKPRLAEQLAAPRSSSRRWRSRSPMRERVRAAPASGTPRAGDRDRRRPDRRAAPARRLAGAARSSAVGDDRLDLALDRLGELLAPAGEHLDAVVLERIVRGGDHHARRRSRIARVR